MKLKKLLLNLAIIVNLVWQGSAFACSAMSFQDGNNKTWFTKSFDYDDYHGYLFVNQRNVLKRALSLNFFKFSKIWFSKYASITFNQISRDYPYGGINEKGLGMEILWLDDTVYPSWTIRNTINESQVIQYILDTSATTEEAIKNLKSVQLSEVYAPVHYMICDKTGECRAIEYLKGKLVITKMERENEKFIQNSIYQEDLARIRKNDGTFRDYPETINYVTSDNKYTKEWDILWKAFGNLDAVIQFDYTKWQIVYNLEEQKVWFRTHENNRTRSLDLNDLEKTCDPNKATLVVDINGNHRGDLKESLIPFNKEMDDEMLSKMRDGAFYALELSDKTKSVAGPVSDFVIDGLKHYNSLNHVCLKPRK